MADREQYVRSKETEYEMLKGAADRLGGLVGTRLGVMAYKHGYTVHGIRGDTVGIGVGQAKSFEKMLDMLNFACNVCEDAITANRLGKPQWPGRVCTDHRRK